MEKILKTVFSLQRNIQTADEANKSPEKIIGYKLLKDGEACSCPITNKYIRQNSIAETKPDKEKSRSAGSSESKIFQKNCSTKCAAFQLFEKNKKQMFKCNWAGFQYEISKVIDNKFNPKEKENDI